MLSTAAFHPRFWFVCVIGLTFVATSPAEPPRVDNHGDPLPDGAVARFGTVRLRRSSVYAVAVVRPDGKMFLDVDDTLRVRTYDSATGRVIGTKQLPGKGASQFLFSKNARVLIGLTADPFTIYHAWDVEAGKEIAKLEKDEPYFVYRAALSPDGAIAALATQQRGKGKLLLWDSARGTDREIGPHTGNVTGVQFSPDAKRLFVLDGVGIHARDVATGAAVWTHKVSTYRYDLDCSADGKFVLAWGGPDGRALMRLNAETGQPVAGDKWPDVSKLSSVAFVPDGRVRMWTYAKDIRLWDPIAGKETLSLPDAGGWSATFPDGKSFLGTYQGFGAMQRWDLATGKPLWPDTRALGHTGELNRLALDPTGRQLATYSDDGSLRLWDVATRTTRFVFPIPRSVTGSMCYSRSGQFLFVSNQDEWIQWDALAGKEVRRVATGPLEQRRKTISMLVSARLSADERELIGTLYVEDFTGGAQGGSVVAWDLETGKERFRRDKAFNRREIALAPDATWFVLGNGKIHDARTGRELRPLLAPPGYHAGTWNKPAFAFSSDGRFVAGGLTRFVQNPKLFQTLFDGAQVWEAATGRPLARLDAGTVACLTFSPDGRTVATADADSLRGWDAATGDLLWTRPVGPLARSVYTLGFAAWIEYSPDGKTIATALPDTTAVLWAVPPRPPRPAALATAAEKDAAWAALLSPDATKGVAAAWALADAGTTVVALLCDRVKPVDPIPENQMRQWVTALDDPAFVKREAATKALAVLGERAEPVLRAALTANPSAEKRQRVEKSLAAPLDAPPPETVRFLRAVQALEAIGTPEARELLRSLAKGDAGAMETKAIAAALHRLNHRTATAAPQPSDKP